MKQKHYHHILVVGGGAVGLAIAGFLSQGNDVSLLCRTDTQASAINKEGIDISGKLGDHNNLRISAASEFKPADYDVIFIATKYGDTATTINNLVDHVGDTIPIVSLQNGVTNSELLRRYFKTNPLVESVIPIGFQKQGMRTTEITFVGDKVIFGGNVQDTTLEAIVKICTEVDFPARTDPNFAGQQWKKYVFNLAYNALSGILNKPNSSLTSWQERHLLKSIIKEAYQIIEREGIVIDGLPTPKSYFNYLVTTSPQLGNHKSSLCQDLNAGRRTEIEALNCELSRKAQEYGFRTPANDAVAEYILALEERRAVDKTRVGFFTDQLIKSCLRLENPDKRDFVPRHKTSLQPLAYTAGMTLALLISILTPETSFYSPLLSPEVRTGFTTPQRYGNMICMDLDHQYTCKDLGNVDPQWLKTYAIRNERY
ncbi:ketopantoate reductase family protein [Candidatus Woesearchaeota archaeon]|nr:ketopantoate reductase family protein [Candidatus Woesearchaeota archaeon]